MHKHDFMTGVRLALMLLPTLVVLAAAVVTGIH